MNNTFEGVRGRVAASLAACLSAGLVACGGGGGSTVATTSVSPSAAASSPDNSSIESYLAYQKTQAPIETIDPQTLQKQLAPLSDTTEPTALN